MGINKVILVGNVGKDPEVRHLDNGTAYARLPLATSESYKGKDGQKVEKTEWHNLVFWRGLAEVVEKWVKKGNQIYVEGSIRTSMSEKDGQKRYFTDIVVRDMQMLGSRKDGANSENGQTAEEPWSGNNNSNQVSNKTSNESTNESIPEGEDDLPF